MVEEKDTKIDDVVSELQNRIQSRAICRWTTLALRTRNPRGIKCKQSYNTFCIFKATSRKSHRYCAKRRSFCAFA